MAFILWLQSSGRENVKTSHPIMSLFSSEHCCFSTKWRLFLTFRIPFSIHKWVVLSFYEDCYSFLWLASWGHMYNGGLQNIFFFFLYQGEMLVAKYSDAWFISFFSIFKFFSLETRYSPPPLPLIYYEWVDLLRMPVVHVMSEVCHSGLGPQHMVE